MAKHLPYKAALNTVWRWCVCVCVLRKTAPLSDLVVHKPKQRRLERLHASAPECFGFYYLLNSGLADA